MPLSQAARDLLLMHVHDCKRPVGWVGRHRFVQGQGNLSYADFGKEQRTQPVELRHRQRLSETRITHAPQSGPEFFRVRALGHLILENAQMLGEHLLEIGLIELLARDIREYGPEAEWKSGSALEVMTGWKQELPIPLHRAHDVESILASLLQGAALPHNAATRQQFDFYLVG